MPNATTGFSDALPPHNEENTQISDVQRPNTPTLQTEQTATTDLVQVQVWHNEQ